MIKAIFLDYIGTLVQETGPEIEALLQRCIAYSNMVSKEEAILWWKQNMLIMEKEFIHENYMTQENICLNLLRLAEKEFKLKDNLNELQNIMIESWTYAPLFSDVRKLIEQINKPIFIITNKNEKYPKVCLKRNDLHVNGIISADSVSACKPHPDIFEYAIRMSGFKAEDILYVGDSYESDILGAKSVGLQAILLDRKHMIEKADCKIVSNLQTVMKYL